MAAYSEACTIAFKREQTDIYDIDQYYRYEITSTVTGKVVGCVYLRKTEVDAADAVPTAFTIA
ncbi:MAG: hypothetical protein Q7J85_05500 [Bacillota bacterium]|nr:hypothetical protein [Bacillota bacterium]